MPHWVAVSTPWKYVLTRHRLQVAGCRDTGGDSHCRLQAHWGGQTLQAVHKTEAVIQSTTMIQPFGTELAEKRSIQSIYYATLSLSPECNVHVQVTSQYPRGPFFQRANKGNCVNLKMTKNFYLISEGWQWLSTVSGNCQSDISK